MESQKMCSKCSLRPASNGHAWCRQCRSAHESDRQITQAEMAMARNWQAGAHALRIAMSAQLQMAPTALFQGQAIAKWIREFPTPDFLSEVKRSTDPTGNQ